VLVHKVAASASLNQPRILNADVAQPSKEGIKAAMSLPHELVNQYRMTAVSNLSWFGVTALSSRHCWWGIAQLSVQT